eukprot:6480223-Amphidinium_carterae.1
MGIDVSTDLVSICSSTGSLESTMATTARAATCANYTSTLAVLDQPFAGSALEVQRKVSRGD